MFLIPENDELKTEINILPMIDVIFAILSFFIVSSLFLTRVETIPINLPNSSTAKKEDKKSLNLSIDSKSRIFINKKIVQISNLRNEIIKLNIEKNSLIIIRGDKSVNYGKIVEVMDIIRSIDNIKIAISTNPT
tara:strand:+ start:4646 stop:5047 length:402 start_codon:yes stop_codon:yes gene_type:complete